MNFKNILSEIEKADPEVYERLSGRRQVLKSFGTKVAMAALPLAVGSLFSKAYGKNTDAVVDILNVALEQEYLEYAFYRHGNGTGGLIPTVDQAGFIAIEAHEKAHIDFLNTTITAMGGVAFKPKHYSDPTTTAPYVPAAYDFTAGGTYPNVFSSYGDFLKIAQILEDTGIHAIKGQMGGLYGNTAVLTQAFELQATEARHAAYVRLVRRLAPALGPEYPAPWITNNIGPVGLQAYYVIEDNVQHNNVVITTLPDLNNTAGVVPQISATAAFDEPYDINTIKGLMAPFKVL